MQDLRVVVSATTSLKEIKMKGSQKIILYAITVMSLIGSIHPALADQNQRGNGNRWAQHESDNSYVHKSYSRQGNNDDRSHHPVVVRIYDQDRPALRRYAEDHYKKYCPKSFIRKHGECLQYGQPVKRYSVGHRLPDNILYYPVPRDIVTHLRPVPTGYEYVRVDNDVLLLNGTTRMVMDAVALLVSGNH